MTVVTDDSIPVTPRAIHDEMIAFGIMTALLAIVPLTGIYPFFVMQALCFALLACAFNLLIGWRLAVVRPCDVFRDRGLRRRARAQGLGRSSRTGHFGRHGCGRGARGHYRLRVDPPPG